MARGVLSSIRFFREANVQMFSVSLCDSVVNFSELGGGRSPRGFFKDSRMEALVFQQAAQ